MCFINSIFPSKTFWFHEVVCTFCFFFSLSLSLGFFFLLFLEVLSNENDYCHHICFTLFTVICEQAMVFFFFVLLLQKILYFVLSLHTKDKNKISESSNGCQFLTYIWPLITCMWQKQCFRDAKYLIKGKYLTFIWPSITCMWRSNTLEPQNIWLNGNFLLQFIPNKEWWLSNYFFHGAGSGWFLQVLLNCKQGSFLWSKTWSHYQWCKVPILYLITTHRRPYCYYHYYCCYNQYELSWFAAGLS